jgi:hypothetical protein
VHCVRTTRKERKMLDWLWDKMRLRKPIVSMDPIDPMEVAYAYSLAPGPVYLMVVPKDDWGSSITESMGEALGERGINTVIMRADFAPIIFELANPENQKAVMETLLDREEGDAG